MYYILHQRTVFCSVSVCNFNGDNKYIASIPPRLPFIVTVDWHACGCACGACVSTLLRRWDGHFGMLLLRPAIPPKHDCSICLYAKNQSFWFDICVRHMRVPNVWGALMCELGLFSCVDEIWSPAKMSESLIRNINTILNDPRDPSVLFSKSYIYFLAQIHVKYQLEDYVVLVDFCCLEKWYDLTTN